MLLVHLPALYRSQMPVVQPPSATSKLLRAFKARNPNENRSSEALFSTRLRNRLMINFGVLGVCAFFVTQEQLIQGVQPQRIDGRSNVT